MHILVVICTTSIHAAGHKPHDCIHDTQLDEFEVYVKKEQAEKAEIKTNCSAQFARL